MLSKFLDFNNIRGVQVSGISIDNIVVIHLKVQSCLRY
jgi:hypothetical protein